MPVDQQQTRNALASPQRTNWLANSLRARAARMLALNSPKDADLLDAGVDLGAGFVPVVGTGMALRDFERARRENDYLGMALSGLGMIPIAGGIARGANKARGAANAVEAAAKLSPLQKLEQVTAQIDALTASNKQYQAAFDQARAAHNQKRPPLTSRAAWAQEFVAPSTAEITSYIDNQRQIASLKQRAVTLQKAIASQQRAEAMRPLKNAMSQHLETIKNAHTNTDLSFRPMSVETFNQASSINSQNPGIRLHKSPVYNGRQSSEYKLVMVDGKPAWARKSNHWGTFSTNVTDVESAVRDLGVTREQAQEIASQDIFGRIGTKRHNWSLSDQAGGRTSRAGYVFVDELLDKARANNDP